MTRPLLAVTGVPVPDLGPEPALYSATPLVMVLGALAIVGVLLFVAQALVANRRAAAGRPLLPLFIITTLLVVAPLGVMYVVMETGRDAAFERSFAYEDRADAEREAVLPLLEDYYGVDIADPSIIPVSGGLPGRTEVTLQDGASVTCFIVADETYDIRCGGSTAGTSEPLPPSSERSAG